DICFQICFISSGKRPFIETSRRSFERRYHKITQEKRSSSSALRHIKSPNLSGSFLYFFQLKKKNLQALRVSANALSLSLLLRFTSRPHSWLFCLLLPLLFTSLKLRFIQPLSHPPPAHYFARLRVAAGC